MNKVLFIDTETTGLDTNQCGVYQIAGIIDIDNKTDEEFDIRTNIFPDDLIVEGALEKGKIALSTIDQYPAPLKAFSSFSNILRKYVDPYDNKDKFIVMAYYADFDNQVLRRWFRMNDNNFFGAWFWHPWIDVMQLAAYVYQDCRAQIESFQLKSISAFSGITVDEDQLHDALYDIRLTRELYYRLMS